MIIDEAHNLAQVIEDSYSFKLDTVILKRVLKEVKTIADEFERVTTTIDKYEIENNRELLLRICEIENS